LQIGGKADLKVGLYQLLTCSQLLTCAQIYFLVAVSLVPLAVSVIMLPLTLPV
jgi:hypothetical protein